MADDGSDPGFDTGAHIDATAPLLGLTITGARRDRVAGFLTLARNMAEVLDAAPVPEDSLAPAPVFDPGATGDQG